LPALTTHERHRILVDWNRTETDAWIDVPFPRLFERQVDQTPDATAAVFGTQWLTYRELNERANRLAHYLIARGVGPEVRVGLCLDRSLDLLVGLLGVVKAGGAYVPLDPSYPADRLAYMLEDSAVPVVITQEALRASPATSRAASIFIDSGWSEIATCSERNTAREILPAAIAYVIYTSGSTGRPKGALIQHRGLSNYLLWAAQEYRADAGNGVPVHSPIGFDLTVTSLFVPLICGRKVSLVPQDQGVGALGEVLSGDSDWTLVKITPAHLDLLARQISPRAAAGQVRTFVVGGEALRGESLAFWREHAPATRIVNEYGPTETVVGCCVFAFPVGEAPDGPIAIGKPIANTQLYVLDEEGQPVPVGVPGELYIGGAGVARGYLNQPALTSTRFVPISGLGGEPQRVYVTGDRVQWRADGNLEFLGRVDEQVKIRGYRIELGEIESVLASYPGVREAVVLAREDTPGDRRLVAYLVWEREPADPAALRAYLKNKLPEYMVPPVSVTLQTLPLTANGKVDRKKLPPPVVASAPPPESIEDSVDPLELQIRSAWQDALRLPSIGLDDDFFELGGHSLHALVVVRRLEQSLGKDLPLSVMLRARTVRQLATLLRQDQNAPVASCLVRLRAGAGRPPFYCVHGAAANILYLEGLARHLAPDIPLYGIQSRGLDGLQEPLTSAEEMAAYYIDEIMKVQPRGPYYLGGLSFGGAIAFEMAQQFQARGEAVGLVALMDTNLPTWRRYTANHSALFANLIYPFVATLEYDFVLIRKNGVRAFLREVLNRLMEYRRSRGQQADNELTLPDGLAKTDLLSATLLRVWTANIEAAEKYSPRMYPGRVSLFYATDWPTPSRHDARLCWADFAGQGLELHRIPGNHGSFRFEPHVRVLAEKLDLCLRRAHETQKL
jgi:amino acid adenylation domain-containing protein